MASGVPRSACRAAGLTRARPLAPRQPMFATCRWSSNSNTPDAPESSHPMPPEPKVVETSADSRPRWSFTPPLAKAPFSLSRPKDPRRSEWKVNDDPAVLDRFYEGFLGPKGPEMLPEELKWQAVTHKSFDQGRRGFNDRLAYLGRQAVALELTKDIIAEAPKPLPADPYGREPFSHPSLDGVNNLAETQPRNIVHMKAMHKLALDLGMMKVVRWKPRMPEHLSSSGVRAVLTHALYAIIGAITLQHGSAVASRVIHERLLKRLR
ncbi:hypothetical protein VUR80DRAFT_10346 [Thermomyces stellatus]